MNRRYARLTMGISFKGLIVTSRIHDERAQLIRFDAPDDVFDRLGARIGTARIPT